MPLLSIKTCILGHNDLDESLEFQVIAPGKVNVIVNHGEKPYAMIDVNIDEMIKALEDCKVLSEVPTNSK